MEWRSNYFLVTSSTQGANNASNLSFPLNLICSWIMGILVIKEIFLPSLLMPMLPSFTHLSVGILFLDPQIFHFREMPIVKMFLILLRQKLRY